MSILATQVNRTAAEKPNQNKMDEVQKELAKALCTFLAKIHNTQPINETYFYIPVKRLIGVTTRTSSIQAILTQMLIPLGEQWPPGQEPVLTKLLVVSKTILDAYLSKLTDINEDDTQDGVSTLSPRPFTEEIKTHLLNESAEENVITGALTILQEFAHSIEILHGVTFQRNAISQIYKDYLQYKDETVDHFERSVEDENIENVQECQNRLRIHWQDLILNLHRFSDLVDNITPGDIARWGVEELTPFDLSSFLKGNENRPDLALMDSDRNMNQAHQESKALASFFQDVKEKIKLIQRDRNLDSPKEPTLE